MQVKVKKLREVMGLLEPVVPRKTTLPILQNVLLRDGKAIAGDMEAFVLVNLPEADIECLIPHKPVMQLLKYVPGNEMLTIEQNKELKFAWDSGKSSYPRAKVAEYPTISEFTATTQATMDGNALIKALVSAAEYSASDDTRPVLSGVIIFPGEHCDIAAGDGFRMAYQTIPDGLPMEKPLIIPSGVVALLNSLWKHTRPDVALGDSLAGLVTQKRHIDVAYAEGKEGAQDKLQLCFGNVTVQLHLIAGTPPNFKQLIPKEIPTKVQIFPADLETTARRLTAISKDGAGIAKLSWTNDTLTVSASSEEMGNAEGTLPVQADNPGQVGINIKYLLEYLKGKEGLITMGVTGETSPIVFRHRASPLVLVMPMHLK